MRIVVLNNCFFSEKQLKDLRRLGELKVYDKTDSEKKIISRLKNADIAVANALFAKFSKKVFKKIKLKLLVINSTGFDFVDIPAARAAGIKVANTPDFATESVAEHAIALIFSVTKKLNLADRLYRERPFEVNPDKLSSKKLVGENIAGKTIGIIGLGRIGKKVAELCSGLGMDVIAYDCEYKKTSKARITSLENLLKKSDIVSLHLPLTPETNNIISEKKLKMMKPTAVLINTARGNLVNTRALYKALKSGSIAGAGLDVLTGIPRNHPILKLKNVVFSPHSAWWTKKSLENQTHTIIKSIKAFIKKRPVNIVN